MSCFGGCANEGSARGGWLAPRLEAPNRTPAPRGCRARECGRGRIGQRSILWRRRLAARNPSTPPADRSSRSVQRCRKAGARTQDWLRLIGLGPLGARLMLGPAGGDAQRPPRTNSVAPEAKVAGSSHHAGGLVRDLGGSGWIRVSSRPRTARRGSPRRPAPCATCRGLRTIRPRGRPRPDGGSRCSRPVPASGGPRR